jgi:hypothetical protein
MDANEHKYYYFNSCSFVFIRGFPYPLSSFLFPISGLLEFNLAMNERRTL